MRPGLICGPGKKGRVFAPRRARAASPPRALMSQKEGKKDKQHAKDRLFTGSQRDACWAKAPPVPGRDPSRWRYDAAGNVRPL